MTAVRGIGKELCELDTEEDKVVRADYQKHLFGDTRVLYLAT